MPRDHSPGSDSDTDADRLQEYEQEYVELQRQYRLLVNDKRNLQQESKEIIDRQNKEIVRLENEHEELESRSRIIKSGSNVRRNEQQCKELEDLGKRKKDYERLLAEEKKKQQELDAEIRELEAGERKQQRRSGGGSAGGRGGGKGEREGGSSSNDKRKLENQLQLANNKYGKLLEDNRILREEIDNLRVERQRFNDLHDRLVLEKEALKQATNEIIEQSTLAYDQRVEAQDKMAALREKNNKDAAQHNNEMKELTRVIRHEENLQVFMDTKSGERREDQLLVMWRDRKEEEAEKRKKDSQTDSVQTYGEALREIKMISGQSDINIIVNEFIEGEHVNFSLLNLVNEQNNNIEKLQDDIARLKLLISELEREGLELEENRVYRIKQLENDQLNSNTDSDLYREKTTELRKLLEDVKQGIGGLFTKISCDRSSIDEELGSEEGVTDGNVIQHLGIIEEKVNQLLLMQAYVTKQQDMDSFIKNQTTLLGDGPQPPNQYHYDEVPAPRYTTKEEDKRNGKEDDRLDEENPMSREELMERARNSVKEKEKQETTTSGGHLVNETQDSDSIDKSSKTKQEKHKPANVDSDEEALALALRPAWVPHF